MKIKKAILLSTVTAIVLAGCSVKPQIIKKDVIQEDAKVTLNALNKILQPVTKPITLDEAIQRAVDHNLNRRVDILNSALSEQKIDVIAYESLPSLTTKAGYSQRDSYAASQSTTYDAQTDTTGALNNSYSISSNKIDKTAGISFSWNILDFGLSYVRANQQANRYLISKEKEKKSIHNIKQEVRNAYYKAVSADELLKRLEPISLEAKKAFEDSKKINALKIDSPIKTLTYQRELLEVIRSLNTLEESLIKSKTELSQLMGLKPGTKFELSEKIKEKYQLPSVDLSIDKLETLALENRPELQETRYQIKISQDEIRTNMLKMLPGLTFNVGYDYSNSDYLANNQWLSYGGVVSWNLLNVFNAPLHNKLAKTQIELAKQQKLALSMAVVSQVHLSLLDLAQAKKEYKLSETYHGVAKEIYDIIKNENALDVNGQLSLIKEKLNFLISNLRLSSSFAKVQNAYGKVISSVGNEKVFKKKEALEKKVENEPLLKIIEPKEEVKETQVNKDEIKTENSFDPSKPAIEIIRTAKLVDKAGGDYTIIKTIEVGTKLNYTDKTYTHNGDYWYEIENGGFIYIGKAIEINEKKPFDESLDSIEIVSEAKLVNMAGGNYHVIETIPVGEKFNYITKVTNDGENYWYELTNGGFIHEYRANKIN